jgi:hypothetical protein
MISSEQRLGYLLIVVKKFKGNTIVQRSFARILLPEDTEQYAGIFSNQKSMNRTLAHDDREPSRQ